METTEPQVEAVRCAACHAVYEHASQTRPNEENTVCPKCGSAAWLAVRVPVPQTGTASSA